MGSGEILPSRLNFLFSSIAWFRTFRMVFCSGVLNNKFKHQNFSGADCQTVIMAEVEDQIKYGD